MAAQLIVVTPERWEEFEYPSGWSLQACRIEDGKAYLVIVGPVREGHT
jgi:hypothetical protein